MPCYIHNYVQRRNNPTVCVRCVRRRRPVIATNIKIDSEISLRDYFIESLRSFESMWLMLLLYVGRLSSGPFPNDLREKMGQIAANALGIARLGIKTYHWWNEALHGVARARLPTTFTY